MSTRYRLMSVVVLLFLLAGTASGCATDSQMEELRAESSERSAPQPADEPAKASPKTDKEAPEKTRSDKDQTEDWARPNLAPEAQPIHAALSAIARDDVEAFRASYHPSLQAKMDDDGPDKVMKIWTDGLSRCLGDAALSDPVNLRYQVKPKGADVAHIIISYGEEHCRPLRVKKAADKWKVAD